MLTFHIEYPSQEEIERRFDDLNTAMETAVEELAEVLRDHLKGVVESVFRGATFSPEVVSKFPVLRNSSDFIRRYMSAMVIDRVDDNEVGVGVDGSKLRKAGIPPNLIPSLEFGTTLVPQFSHWRFAYILLKTNPDIVRTAISEVLQRELAG